MSKKDTPPSYKDMKVLTKNLINLRFDGIILTNDKEEGGENDMEQTLIKEKKYDGRYVALKDFDEHTVIADGKDPQEAYEMAVKKGCPNPVILYIPVKGMVQIY